MKDIWKSLLLGCLIGLVISNVLLILLLRASVLHPGSIAPTDPPPIEERTDVFQLPRPE